jgi:hypothetical protein
MERMLVVALALTMTCGCVKAVRTSLPRSLLPPNEYILYAPTEDGASLLGREVIAVDDGYEIRPHPKPGCKVRRIETHSDTYERESAQHMQYVVSLDASMSRVGGVSMEAGSEMISTLKVENSKVLTAQLEGDCGDKVITKVKIGVGQRTVMTSEHGSGGVSLGLAQTNIAAALRAKGFKDADLNMSWTQPQAWGFEVGDGKATVDTLELRVTLEPTVVADGDTYRVWVEANEPLLLLIIAQEPDNRAAVVVPAMQNGSIYNITVPAATQHALPAATAHLRDPGVEQYDTLIVYGLRHEEDLDALDLNLGEMSDTGRTDQATSVMNALAKLPASRVVREEVGYRIVPRSPGSTQESHP